MGFIERLRWLEEADLRFFADFFLQRLVDFHLFHECIAVGVIVHFWMSLFNCALYQL